MPGEAFEHALDDGQARPRAPSNDLDLDADDLRGAGRRRTRRSSPSTPAATSRRSRASSSTWPSARSSTRGTPTGPCSTAGRSASRPTSAPRSTWWRWSSATSAPTPAPASPSPATRAAARRASTATTWPTRRARTWWPASATPCRCRTWSSIDKTAYDELMRIMATLEEHYRDLCDIEFTIERGKLWMLQTRVGKRTAAAAFVIADPARRRGRDRPGRGAAPGHRRAAGPADVPDASTSAADTRSRSPRASRASPGAAVGKAVFDSRARGRGGRRRASR